MQSAAAFHAWNCLCLQFFLRFVGPTSTEIVLVCRKDQMTVRNHVLTVQYGVLGGSRKCDLEHIIYNYVTGNRCSYVLRHQSVCYTRSLPLYTTTGHRVPRIASTIWEMGCSLHQATFAILLYIEHLRSVQLSSSVTDRKNATSDDTVARRSRRRNESTP